MKRNKSTANSPPVQKYGKLTPRMRYGKALKNLKIREITIEKFMVLINLNLEERAEHAEEIAEQLLSNEFNYKDFAKLKLDISASHKSGDVVRNSEVIKALEKLRDRGKLTDEQFSKLKKSLRVGNIRSSSGVSVIAVMTAPLPCPGRCTYCPGGITSPKSYTGFEPSARRSAQNNFDPFKTVSNRLEQLKITGHNPEKCELIVQGGTFNSLPFNYQTNFLKRAFDAFNEIESKDLQEAQKLNEVGKHRVVGLTLETRPNFCRPRQVSQMIDFGMTRIEIGVQTLDEKVNEITKRDQTNEQVATATATCKDAFLKMCYHMMPGLYSTRESDIWNFKELFKNDDYKPDMLKIYPCLVMPGTELYEEWKAGKFKPYDSQKAAEVIAECKQFIPEYCRVMRIDRDIPTNLVADGVKNSNLRQMIGDEMKKKNLKCKCIRCREVGLQRKLKPLENIQLKRIDYTASNGKETFLSFEDFDQNILLGFIRMRQPFAPFRPEITPDTLGIRELHVYGQQVPISQKAKDEIQHKKFGELLLKEAERIAKEEFQAKKLLVISGIGVREYYKKKGYVHDGMYMGKTLVK